jgi:hypothetical protein
VPKKIRVKSRLLQDSQKSRLDCMEFCAVTFKKHFKNSLTTKNFSTHLESSAFSAQSKTFPHSALLSTVTKAPNMRRLKQDVVLSGPPKSMLLPAFRKQSRIRQPKSTMWSRQKKIILRYHFTYFQSLTSDFSPTKQ